MNAVIRPEALLLPVDYLTLRLLLSGILKNLTVTSDTPMVRPPSKILSFKRLTRGTRDPAWHLDSNISQKTQWIIRKLRASRIGPTDRAYLYVAMATCLEADLKHQASSRPYTERLSRLQDSVRRGEARHRTDLSRH